MLFPKLIQDLIDLKVTRSLSGKCTCGGDIIVYKLPFKLDKSIILYMDLFGKSPFDFDTTHLFKIETDSYAINGVKNLKEIRFTLKDKDNFELLNNFETKLLEYARTK